MNTIITSSKTSETTASPLSREIHAADSGAEHSQNEWTTLHNKNDSVMASAADLYAAARAGTLPESCTRDLSQWLIASTTVNTNQKNLEGRITHYDGSAIRQPQLAAAIPIPVYKDVPVENVLGTPDGLCYARALFSTEDDAARMTATLENLFGKEKKDITFRTPSLSLRKGNSRWATAYSLNGIARVMTIPPAHYIGRSYTIGAESHTPLVQEKSNTEEEDNPQPDPSLVNLHRRVDLLDFEDHPEPRKRKKQTPASDLSSLTLDAAAAENGASKTQDDWIRYWNAVTDSRYFASAADLYQVFKQLQHNAEHGPLEQKTAAEALTASLRKNFGESWLVTSTRISYAPPSPQGTITHHYGATKAGLEKRLSVIDIPVYEGVSIATLLQDKLCEQYLQQLFDTLDGTNEIVSVLEYVSGKQRTDIKLWTPPMRNTQWLGRHEQRERAAGFGVRRDGFRVGGLNRVGGDGGRSLGVRSRS